jgi:ectoine hydroxylase-related dioxygenase (phytanoyl-CoA dioxygenase family)
MEAADRVGRLNFWVALDEVTPEMGAMRFVTGSHREGPLGWPLPEEYLQQLREDDGRIDPATMGTKARELGEDAIKALHERDVLWQYPKLLDIYEFSPPFHYQPGDATVHQGWMIHGAPPNRTERDRWCYIIEYSPADVRYRNSRYGDRDLGTPLSDDAAYPVVHPQSALA